MLQTITLPSNLQTKKRTQNVWYDAFDEGRRTEGQYTKWDNTLAFHSGHEINDVYESKKGCNG